MVGMTSASQWCKQLVLRTILALFRTVFVLLSCERQKFFVQQCSQKLKPLGNLSTTATDSTFHFLPLQPLVRKVVS
jgi:hypothetical protein